MTLLRTAWVWLNRLCISVGRFCSSLYKYGMASSAASECGAEGQTFNWIIEKVLNFKIGFQDLEKVLNFKIGFQDLDGFQEQVLNLPKMRIRYWKSVEILNGKEILSTWAQFYWRRRSYAVSCNV